MLTQYGYMLICIHRLIKRSINLTINEENMKTIKLTDKEIKVLDDALNDYINEWSEVDSDEQVRTNIKTANSVLKKMGKIVLID
jgi:hypothetical protein